MTMRSQAYQAPTPTTVSRKTPSQPLPTFLEHVHELRRRLFWVVATVLVVSTIAYSFLSTIISVLTAPLGDQHLYYLTPVGGLTFAIKLCSFVGILAAIPVMVYHLYKYVEPLMGTWRKPVIFYVSLSTFFATVGVVFAYFISLPAALHFLTNFNIGEITAMLTVDSYLSFVLTYLLGAALLFQIPLVLLIINTMTPLTPSKLMGLQRYVIVGAFILAAIISPTPDIMNQTFLALPIVAMYQVGVVLVWLQQRALKRRAARGISPTVSSSSVPADVLYDLTRSSPPLTPAALTVGAKATLAKVSTAIPAASKPTLQAKPFNDITVRRAPRPITRIPRPVVAAAARPALLPMRSVSLRVPARSIDGFVVSRVSA